jgi:hypothetical protein
MATNSSRGNPIAAADGPPVETAASPHPVPESLKADIHQRAEKGGASSGGSAGLHATGQDTDAATPEAHVGAVEEMAGQGGSNTGTGRS